MPNDRPAALPVYRFGGFTLDNHRGVLLSPDGQEVALRPKALQLLCLLVENAGEVIDRDRIMRSVWPGVTIGDDGSRSASATSAARWATRRSASLGRCRSGATS